MTWTDLHTLQISQSYLQRLLAVFNFQMYRIHCFQMHSSSICKDCYWLHHNLDFRSVHFRISLNLNVTFHLSEALKYWLIRSRVNFRANTDFRVNYWMTDFRVWNWDWGVLLKFYVDPAKLHNVNYCKVRKMVSEDVENKTWYDIYCFLLCFFI